MLKQTPLHAVHRAAGARMVDFGGWDMPVHYGSQIDEHHAVRSDAGMFDVSHMRVVDLEGAGARDFLRYALANNVDKLKESGQGAVFVPAHARRHGHRRPDRLLPARGPLPDRRQRRHGRQGHRVAGQASARTRARSAPHAADRPRDDRGAGTERARQGLAGAPRQRSGQRERSSPSARRSMKSAWGEVFIARTGYTGEDGFEIVLPATHAASLWHALDAAGVKPAGLGARDTLRLEAGMNLYGQDMDERTSPLESGLAWTVDLASPRDFVGKAALARTGAAARVDRAPPDRQGGRPPRAPGRAHCAGRWRDHERHLQPEPRQVDRAGAAAGRLRGGRGGQGRRSRPRARGESGEAAVRPQRQGARDVTGRPRTLPAFPFNEPEPR